MPVESRLRVDRPVLFCLHYLGGSAREWAQVAVLLGDLRCVPIDLPGFGAAARTPGYTVADMVATVAQAVRAAAPRRWILVGHSMGAKIATVLARHAEDGAPGLAGLEGLILLAGSPPSPEPMDEEQRQMMMSWFAGDAGANRADAQRYVSSNTAGDLDAPSFEGAVTDALRANRAAWLAWLERGSREDWADAVGVLQSPALVIAGADDVNLGPEAQRRLVLPHLAHVRLVTLAATKHLLPLERPHEIARSLGEHVRFVEAARERVEATDIAYRALIGSDRVSSGTRQALLARARPDDPAYEPVALDAPALATLRAVVGRVVPQTSCERIDLAARIDAQLAQGVGDGWRFDQLPCDAEAYRAGLLTLNDEARRLYEREYIQLDAARQGEMLERVGNGRLHAGEAAATPPCRLNAKQMQAWFEDVRADAVRAYVGHPQTLARLGYSGIANGGDGEPKSGFVRVGIGEREAWEPLPSAERAP